MFNSFFASAQQGVQTYGGGGLTTLEGMLIAGIVSVVGSIGATILWIIRSAIPQILAALATREDRLIAIFEKMAAEFPKISAAIESFKVDHVGSEKRLIEEIHESREMVVKELHDSRISELTRAVQDRTSVSPSSQVGPPKKG